MRKVTFVALLLVLLADLPMLIPPPFGLTDHLVFWKAGEIVGQGGSPYAMSAWVEAQRVYTSGHLAPFVDANRPVWVYPAWTAFLFVPFGWLPYPAGPWVLYLSYLVIGIAATILFVRSLPEPWRTAAEPAIPLAALFQPLVIADRYGQFGSFLLLGVVLVYLGLLRRRTALLSAGALLLFTKPQLFGLLVPVVLWVLVRWTAWRTVAVVGSLLAAVAIVTTLRYPESLASFSYGANERVTTYLSWYSTTWGFAMHILGAAWLPASLTLIALAAAATAVAVRRLPTELRLAGAVAGACALSLAVAPVDFHYDQSPLILMIVLAVAVGRGPLQIAATWITAAVVPWFVFFVALNIGGTDSQSLSGVVPLLFGPLLLLATASGRAAQPPDPARPDRPRGWTRRRSSPAPPQN